MFQIHPLGTKLKNNRSVEKGMKSLRYEDLESVISKNNPNHMEAYIFYQPGDLHDASILGSIYLSLWIRVGDLHHLKNPLIRSIRFLASVYGLTEKILLNTNPAFLPLLRYIFPRSSAMPISEITINEGLLHESARLESACAFKSRKNLVYIGSRESPFHPRRTFWISSLLNDPRLSHSIDHFQSLEPIEWLQCCSVYNTVLAPSLNSQWSHNIFVPNLGGAAIFTDCQALPSYNYYSDPKTNTLSACMFSYTLSSFRERCANSVSLDVFPKLISAHARSHMEAADRTYSNIFSRNSLCPSRDKLPLFESHPDSFLQVLIAANIFEVLQEIIRAMIIYDQLSIVCDSQVLFVLFTRYFPHPRMIFSFYPRISTRRCNETTIKVDGHALSVGMTEDLLTLYADMNTSDASSIELSCREFGIKKLRSYAILQRRLKETIGAEYKIAEFNQQLVNSVEIAYH